jgi:hypothetical protein
MNKNHKPVISGHKRCPAMLESRGLGRLQGLGPYTFEPGPSRDSQYEMF